MFYFFFFLNSFFQIFKGKKKNPNIFVLHTSLAEEGSHQAWSLWSLLFHSTSFFRTNKDFKNKTLKIMTSGDEGMTHMATLPRRYHNSTQLAPGANG